MKFRIIERFGTGILFLSVFFRHTEDKRKTLGETSLWKISQIHFGNVSSMKVDSWVIFLPLRLWIPADWFKVLGKRPACPVMKLLQKKQPHKPSTSARFFPCILTTYSPLFRSSVRFYSISPRPQYQCCQQAGPREYSFKKLYCNNPSKTLLSVYGLLFCLALSLLPVVELLFAISCCYVPFLPCWQCELRLLLSYLLFLWDDPISVHCRWSPFNNPLLVTHKSEV